MNFAIIIPTLNAGPVFAQLLHSITVQTAQPKRKIVIDSSSDDETVVLAKKNGFEVLSITRSEFNHGSTRQAGVKMVAEQEAVVFLTQDTVLANKDALNNLLRALKQNKVGAAYGRQLPHQEAGPLGAHARLFNYPVVSRVKSMADTVELGIKTAFFSNSFSAYRRKALASTGGFPNHVILGEDTFVAAKMLLTGWKIAYSADAQVYHSHDYTIIQEFRRYFDIGVFHAREPWIREKLGQAEGEGFKFVLSEAKYLLNHGKWYLLPLAFMQTCLKYAGYRLGMTEKCIPNKLKKYFSMHRRFWDLP